jgi:hypothetical protein
MATTIYHPKVLRTIEAVMRCHARQEVKDQIRARNQRVTDYDPRDISAMARTLLQSKPEVSLERARASVVVKELEAKLAAQAARKAQRKSGHTLPWIRAGFSITSATPVSRTPFDIRR